MDYTLHITRAADWFDTAGAEIAVEEWLALVARDPELAPDPADGPYVAVWRPAGGAGDGWLDWHMGRLFTTSPSQPFLAKMAAVAAALGAKVQGDEGERYEGTEPVGAWPAGPAAAPPPPPGLEPAAPADAATSPRRRTWLDRLFGLS